MCLCYTRHYAVFLIALITVTAAPVDNPKDYGETAMTWKRRAHDKLLSTITIQPIVKRARNVILFLGDGMGISTVTAARLLNNGETSLLYFENFPNVALSKTYCANSQVTDSAASSTAYQCGVKTGTGVLGLDPRVQRLNCTQSLEEGMALTSILDWSLEDGRSVGLVTNTRITHATPAGAYANTPERHWEGDADLTADAKSEGCRDIARQLIEDYPNAQVIMGGGRRYFYPDNDTVPGTTQPNSQKGRQDGRNLINEWLQSQKALQRNAAYVWNATQLRQVDIEQTDSILGLFAQSHMDFEKNRKTEEQPSLTEMTTTAIRLLSKNPKGFYLLVEGGLIDQSHHNNVAYHALYDTIAFSKAIEAAATLTSEDDTLTVTTADHSHTLVIAGYSSRGNGMLNVNNQNSDTDGQNFTSLLYGDGPGYRRAAQRVSPTNEQSNMPNYTQEAVVPLSSASHGGEDVGIYAKGPMAHLLRGVQEENYIAHVMAYASCVGQYKKTDTCAPASGASAITCRRCMLADVVVSTWLVAAGALASRWTVV